MILPEPPNYVLYGKFPYNIPVRGLMRTFSIYDAILGYYTENLPHMTPRQGLIGNIDPIIRLSQTFDDAIGKQYLVLWHAVKSPLDN